MILATSESGGGEEEVGVPFGVEVDTEGVREPDEQAEEVEEELEGYV